MKFIAARKDLPDISCTRTDAKGAIFHIFPDFIANTISNVPSVRDCVVVCISHPVLKSIPIGFVVSESSDSREISAEVSAYCENKLPEHSRPKAVYTIDSVPKTAVGKPDYKFLETIAAERFLI